VRHLTVYAALAAMALLSATTVRAQLTSLNSDSHTIIGARAAALADAVTSQANDATTLYWNPAGLSYLMWMSVPMTVGIEDFGYQNYAVTANVVVPLPAIKNWSFAVGGTTHQFHQSGNASPLRGLSYSQNDLTGGISYRIIPALSLGATIRALVGQSASKSLWALSGSLGLLYEPQPGVSYGLVLHGLGDGVRYPYENPNDLNDIHVGALPRSMQVGLSISFPTTTPESPSLILALANQKIFGESGVVYKLAMEYWPFSAVALRAGYWVGPATVSGKYGAAFRISTFQVDYAISPGKTEPRFHQLTLSYLIAQH
jgi:hypothetical protein